MIIGLQTKEKAMQPQKTLLAVAMGIAMSQVSVAQADIVETLKEGDVIADFRLRYETNDTEGGADAATALTLRSRLGYETPSMAGVKVMAELEDVRAVIDEYAPEDTDYDTVADPANTEINRFQLSYAKDNFAAVIGRQRIILDNARFIGNVGWRQNEQTYDAALFSYKTDDVTLAYAYIDQVNGILFNDTDVTAHALNAAFTGLSAGKLVTYAYLAEMDDVDYTLNTYGASFAGKTAAGDTTITYRAELATQTQDNGGVENDAMYYALEAGAVISGVTLAVGNETLGSDDGAFGFSTPFATKHAFNGWADKFLGTPADGLSDTYVKAVGVVSGVKLLGVYHTYSAVEGSDDKGSEINLLAAKKIDKNFSVGLKYAGYTAGDSGADTDKLWAWAEAKF